MIECIFDLYFCGGFKGAKQDKCGTQCAFINYFIEFINIFHHRLKEDFPLFLWTFCWIIGWILKLLDAEMWLGNYMLASNWSELR